MSLEHIEIVESRKFYKKPIIPKSKNSLKAYFQEEVNFSRICKELIRLTNNNLFTGYYNFQITDEYSL